MKNERKPRMVTKSVKIGKGLLDEIDKIRREKSFTDFVRAALVDKVYEKNTREMLSLSAINSIHNSLDRIEYSLYEMDQELKMHRRWMFHRDISFNLQHAKLPKEVRKEHLEEAKERAQINLWTFLNRYGYDPDIYKDIHRSKSVSKK